MIVMAGKPARSGGVALEHSVETNCSSARLAGAAAPDGGTLFDR